MSALVDTKVRQLEKVRNQEEVAKILTGVREDTMIEIMKKLKDPVMSGYVFNSVKTLQKEAVSAMSGAFRLEVIRYTDKKRALINALGVRFVEGVVSATSDFELKEMYVDNAPEIWRAVFREAAQLEKV